MGYEETLNSIGESIIKWADPTNEYTGYTDVGLMRTLTFSCHSALFLLHFCGCSCSCCFGETSISLLYSCNLNNGISNYSFIFFFFFSFPLPSFLLVELLSLDYFYCRLPPLLVYANLSFFFLCVCMLLVGMAPYRLRIRIYNCGCVLFVCRHRFSSDEGITGNGPVPDQVRVQCVTNYAVRVHDHRGMFLSVP